MKYYRHGDVTMQELSEIPEKYKDAMRVKTKKAVVALGEVTGHHHRVIPVGDSVIEMLSLNGEKPHANDEDIVLLINGEGLLVHEEHAPILLKTGIYSRGIKRQFNPFTDSTELVRD